MRFDIKSLLIGVLAATCFFLVLGQNAGTVSTYSPSGRYQISAWQQPGENVHGVFLLDTETGRVQAAAGYIEVRYDRGTGRFEHELWRFSEWRPVSPGGFRRQDAAPSPGTRDVPDAPEAPELPAPRPTDPAIPDAPALPLR